MIIRRKSTNILLLHNGGNDTHKTFIDKESINKDLVLIFLGILNIFILRDNNYFKIYIYDFSMNNVGTEREVYLRSMHIASDEEKEAIIEFLNNSVDKDISFDYLSNSLVNLIKKFNTMTSGTNYVWNANNADHFLKLDTIPNNFKLILSGKHFIIKRNEFLFEGVGGYTSFIPIDRFMSFASNFIYMEKFLPKFLYNSKSDKYKLKKNILHMYYRPDLYGAIDNVMNHNLSSNLVSDEPIFFTLPINFDNIYNYNIVRTFGSKNMVFGKSINNIARLELTNYTKSLLNHLISASNISAINNELYYPFVYNSRSIPFFSINDNTIPYDKFIYTYNSIATNYCYENSASIEAIENYFSGKFKELVKLIEIMVIDNMIDNYLSWDLTILDSEASKIVDLVNEVIILNDKFSEEGDMYSDYTKVDTALMYLNVLYGYNVLRSKGVSADKYNFDVIVPLLIDSYGKLEVNIGLLGVMPDINVIVKGHYMIWILNNILNKNYLEE